MVTGEEWKGKEQGDPAPFENSRIRPCTSVVLLITMTIRYMTLKNTGINCSMIFTSVYFPNSTKKYLAVMPCYAKTSRLGRRKCQSTTREPNNVVSVKSTIE